MAARTVAARTAKIGGVRPEHSYGVDDISTQRRVTQPRSSRAKNPANILTVTVDPALLRERLAALNLRRQAQGCSLTALAHALGVSRSTLTRVLQGQPVRHGPAREFNTLEGLQRIEIALDLFARATTPARPRTPGNQLKSQAPKPTRSGAKNATLRSDRTSIATSPTTLDSRQEVAHAATAVIQEAPQIRVLIVEDDAPTVDLYRLVLAEERAIHYRMDVARTAQECLKRLRGAQSYDILLMDLGVSDMHAENDEESLLATFERQPQLLPQRILVVSGISPYRLQLKRTRLAALGVAFMPKPFDVDDLLLALRSLVITAGEPAQGLSFFALPED